MAAFLKGNLPGPSAPSPLPSGPLMSLRAYASLTAAPRKAPIQGTMMRVRAYDIPWLIGSDEHMYTEYDDGAESYIFRGGPTVRGLAARVDPAPASPDFGRGGRILYQQLMPGIPARDAKIPAERFRDRINRENLPYLGWVSNSNYAASRQVEDQTGYRPGDDLTPGWAPSLLPVAPSQPPWGWLPRSYRRPPQG